MADGRNRNNLSAKQRSDIGRKGGKAKHSVRGFQAMDKDRQREIASMGGKASRGGGRSRSS